MKKGSDTNEKYKLVDPRRSGMHGRCGQFQTSRGRRAAANGSCYQQGPQTSGRDPSTFQTVSMEQRGPPPRQGPINVQNGVSGDGLSHRFPRVRTRGAWFKRRKSVWGAPTSLRPRSSQIPAKQALLRCRWRLVHRQQAVRWQRRTPGAGGFCQIRLPPAHIGQLACWPHTTLRSSRLTPIALAPRPIVSVANSCTCPRREYKSARLQSCPMHGR
jgi:hypothetical protein